MIPYRLANRALLGAIILVNGYVITAPLLPRVTYQVGQLQGQNRQLQAVIDKPAAPDTPNSLIIPVMHFQGPIYGGNDTYAQLNKGAWRWPGSSTPDKDSNTVVLAHRFTYTNPRGTFYFLDKLKPGDRIGVIWNQHTYTYHVVNSRTVSPGETTVLAPTKTPTLTLYTCTPLWNPTERLVVTATLVGRS